jgi:hypothetical protein
MYIAPNNTKYLELGKNASTIVIGASTLANTKINTAVNGTAGQIILNKTAYNNNTIAYDAANGIIDVITTANDSFDSNGNNSNAKAIMIRGSDLNYGNNVDWNKTGTGEWCRG